jgi:hypothetical protein
MPVTVMPDAGGDGDGVVAAPGAVGDVDEEPHAVTATIMMTSSSHRVRTTD